MRATTVALIVVLFLFIREETISIQRFVLFGYRSPSILFASYSLECISVVNPLFYQFLQLLGIVVIIGFLLRCLSIVYDIVGQYWTSKEHRFDK